MFKRILGPSKKQLNNEINVLKNQVDILLIDTKVFRTIDVEHGKNFMDMEERLVSLTKVNDNNTIKIFTIDRRLTDCETKLDNRLNHIDHRLNELSNKCIKNITADIQHLLSTLNSYENSLVEVNSKVNQVEFKYRPNETKIDNMQEILKSHYRDLVEIKDTVKKITTSQQATIDKLEGDIETIMTKHRYQVSGLKGHITRSKNK